MEIPNPSNFTNGMLMGYAITTVSSTENGSVAATYLFRAGRIGGSQFPHLVGFKTKLLTYLIHARRRLISMSSGGLLYPPTETICVKYTLFKRNGNYGNNFGKRKSIRIKGHAFPYPPPIVNIVRFAFLISTN